MDKSSFNTIINKSWHSIFSSIDDNIFENTEDKYINISNKSNIYPSFENIFNFTKYSSFEDLKVVILGQDPYHSVYYDKDIKQNVGIATGLSFSIPKKCSIIPPSLINIYDNLSRHKNIIYKPVHGCLDYWAFQGVLLLNTRLTVEQSKPNSHQYIWTKFVDELIQNVSIQHPELIFILWGKNALTKMNIIKDKDKHHFSISSHPSPLSCYNRLQSYDSFYNTDHFGNINNILNSNNKYMIDWQIY